MSSKEYIVHLGSEDIESINIAVRKFKGMYYHWPVADRMILIQMDKILN